MTLEELEKIRKKYINLNILLYGILFLLVILCLYLIFKFSAFDTILGIEIIYYDVIIIPSTIMYFFCIKNEYFHYYSKFKDEFYKYIYYIGLNRVFTNAGIALDDGDFLKRVYDLNSFSYFNSKESSNHFIAKYKDVDVDCMKL